MKKIKKEIEKWANSIPWKPKDLIIELGENYTRYKPVNETFENDEYILGKLSSYIDGAYYFMLWKEEKNDVNLVRYRKKLYIKSDLTTEEILIGFGSIPSYKIIERVDKGGGLVLLTRLSDHKLRYVYKNEKLEKVKITEKIRKKYFD